MDTSTTRINRGLGFPNAASSSSQKPNQFESSESSKSIFSRVGGVFSRFFNRGAPLKQFDENDYQHNRREIKKNLLIQMKKWNPDEEPEPNFSYKEYEPRVVQVGDRLFTLPEEREQFLLSLKESKQNPVSIILYQVFSEEGAFSCYFPKQEKAYISREKIEEINRAVKEINAENVSEYLEGSKVIRIQKIRAKTDEGEEVLYDLHTEADKAGFMQALSERTIVSFQVTDIAYPIDRESFRGTGGEIGDLYYVPLRCPGSVIEVDEFQEPEDDEEIDFRSLVSSQASFVSPIVEGQEDEEDQFLNGVASSSASPLQAFEECEQMISLEDLILQMNRGKPAPSPKPPVVNSTNLIPGENLASQQVLLRDPESAGDLLEPYLVPAPDDRVLAYRHAQVVIQRDTQLGVPLPVMGVVPPSSDLTANATRFLNLNENSVALLAIPSLISEEENEQAILKRAKEVLLTKILSNNLDLSYKHRGVEYKPYLVQVGEILFRLPDEDVGFRSCLEERNRKIGIERAQIKIELLEIESKGRIFSYPFLDPVRPFVQPLSVEPLVVECPVPRVTMVPLERQVSGLPSDVPLPQDLLDLDRPSPPPSSPPPLVAIPAAQPPVIQQRSMWRDLLRVFGLDDDEEEESPQVSPHSTNEVETQRVPHSRVTPRGEQQQLRLPVVPQDSSLDLDPPPLVQDNRGAASPRRVVVTTPPPESEDSSPRRGGGWTAPRRVASTVPAKVPSKSGSSSPVNKKKKAVLFEKEKPEEDKGLKSRSVTKIDTWGDWYQNIWGDKKFLNVAAWIATIALAFLPMMVLWISAKIKDSFAKKKISVDTSAAG